MGSVDINSAGIDELAALPGIGRTVAFKIVEHRDRFGRFRSTAELMLIDGVSEARYLRIRSSVCAGEEP